MLTCWISLHETTADAGPIEYVRGSHLWPKSPPERSQFHAPEDWLAPARNAAPEGAELDLVPVVVKPGGGSFHHGLTWHGSAPNTNASVARMALVTHMLPVEVRFHETNVDLVYSRYRRQGDLALDESFFPVLWDETGYRTPWLASPARDRLKAGCAVTGFYGVKASCLELVVEVAGELSFDAAACFAWGLAVAEEALVVGGGFGVVADAVERDHVEGPVELAVAAAVEPVALVWPLEASTGLVPARAANDASLSHPVGVAAGDDQLGGADGADAAFGEQLGRELADDLFRARRRSRRSRSSAAGRGRLSGARPRPRPLSRRCAGAVCRASFGGLVAVEAAQVAPERLGGGHDHGLQLVQRGGARSDSAAALEQKQAQSSRTPPPRGPEAAPLQQPLRGQRSRRSVALPSAALPTAWPLTLEHHATRAR